MKTVVYDNYIDYLNSNNNSWSYVVLDDFIKAKDKAVKVCLDKNNNEIDIVFIDKKKQKKYTLNQIKKSWLTAYGENMAKEYKGFFNLLKKKGQ